MTLSHEHGHVHLHAYLFELRERQVSGLPKNHDPNGIYCKRDTIEFGVQDRLAGMAGQLRRERPARSGQLVRQVVGPTRSGSASSARCTADQREHGVAMIGVVAEAFKISRDAARVRLSVLGILGAPRADRLALPEAPEKIVDFNPSLPHILAYSYAH